MSFQERLITALFVLLVLYSGVWAFKGDGPDPSLVVTAITGLIGTVWGAGTIASAVKRNSDTKDGNGGDAK